MAKFLTEVGTMSSTAKVSISVPDEDLLRWAKERSEKTGMSLSAVFTEAVRFERQMEARRQFLEEMGPEGVPTPEEAAAIRAEWETGPLPPAEKKPARTGRAVTKGLAKRARAADKLSKRSPSRTAAKR